MIEPTPNVLYADLESRLGPRIIVQQMIPDSVELLLGVVNDPQFGPMLVIGLGGIFVEVLNDRRLVVLPPSRLAIKEALFNLRGAAMLNEVRGRPAADVEAVVEAAIRLSALALDLGDRLTAIDINPLIVLPHGAVAVDALIVPL